MVASCCCGSAAVATGASVVCSLAARAVLSGVPVSLSRVREGDAFLVAIAVVVAEIRLDRRLNPPPPPPLPAAPLSPRRARERNAFLDAVAVAIHLDRPLPLSARGPAPARAPAAWRPRAPAQGRRRRGCMGG